MERLRNFWRKLRKDEKPLANIPAESKWRPLEDKLRVKYKVGHTPRLEEQVTNSPDTLIPVIERAAPEKVIPILLHTIHNLQEDNDKSKGLAKKVIAKYISQPAVVRKKIVKREGTGGQEEETVIKFTSFTRQEMNELRGLFVKGEKSDIDWLLHLYERRSYTHGLCR